MSKKKIKSKLRKKKNVVVRKPNRYNEIQKIVSAYGKETGIKFGNTFSKTCSIINEKTKGTAIKYVDQNIGALYQEYAYKAEPIKEFPNDFEYYDFNFNLQLPVFDGIIVSYTFNDGQEEFYIKGNVDDVKEYFNSGTYGYLRRWYDGSPPNNAQFKILKTDNKTFVDYEIKTFHEPQAKSEPKTEPVAPITPQNVKTGVSYTAQEIIAIEKEKQKTAKAISKLIKEYKALGYTNEEIRKKLDK